MAEPIEPASLLDSDYDNDSAYGDRFVDSGLR